MKVLKFGGSSVGTPERISTIVDIISSALKRERQANGNASTRYPLVVVVSAFQGVTDGLVALARFAARGDESFRDDLHKLEDRHLQAVQKLVPAAIRASVLANVKSLCHELEDILQGVLLVRELSARTLDSILSFGERLSAYIVAEACKVAGLEAQFLDTRDLIVTDSNFGNARALKESEDRIRDYFASHAALQIATGFIGATFDRENTTFGRGGSDYTAAVLGAALEVDEIEIWTDVDGMLTADPNKVKKAFPLERVTFEEAMELCHFGAKVLYPPTIQPALTKSIPIRILNTFNPNFSGTLISTQGPQSIFPVTGVTSINNVALLLIEGIGMVGVPGIAARVFSALANKSINIILITQASSEHTICLGIDPAQVDNAASILETELALERKAGLIEPVRVVRELAIVSVVGEAMRSTPGISATFFSALGHNGINVRAIAQGSSERNISAVIQRADEIKALNAVHDAFFLSGTRTLNLYLAGTGLVGSTLLKQIAAQQRYLRDSLSLEIKLAGILNSRQMLLADEGVALGDALALLDKKGARSDFSLFADELRRRNLSNAVFVDCTASDKVVDTYEQILSGAISVVTPNKKAQSGPLARYLRIKAKAQRAGVNWLYETSVGAGLPIINTLNDLLNSGDEIESIDAILSGTLSYLFNNFVAGVKFSELIVKARAAGYTEPDPRDDLSGLDVGRKLLTLVREIGYRMEISEIDVENLVPEPLRNLPSVEKFIERLPELDTHFDKLRTKAAEQGSKLCYLARLECGPKPKAWVRLTEIDSHHAFANLSGADNIIAFTTRRYRDRPLVVKGPGAGAEVTAAGVFADVLRVARHLH